MNLKSFFPLFMLEYAGVLREFTCVCVNMLELLVFAFICWVRLCLSGVYLNMLEFACISPDPARSVYPDAIRSGSTG